MMNVNTEPPRIVSFLLLTTLILIVLKVTNYIDWSWLWIFSPIWIPFVILVVLFIIARALE